MNTTTKRAFIAFGVSTLLTAGAIALSDFRPAIAQEKPELRVAAIIAVTGPASALGAPERNAVELFDKTWSSRNDLPFKIKIISYDDGSDPTKSVSLTRKAIEEDKVHVVVCCTTTPSAEPPATDDLDPRPNDMASRAMIHAHAMCVRIM